MIDYIEIWGYKSIKHQKVEIRPINVLIGANGAGKSNFVAFFSLLENLFEQKLKLYVASNGGYQKFLHLGPKVTRQLKAVISFDKEVNRYSFTLSQGEGDFFFTNEILWYQDNPLEITDYKDEARIKTHGWYRSSFLRKHLSSFKKYHFHDTGKQSPFNGFSNIDNDIYVLYEKGENLAAFLFEIQRKYDKIYQRIVKIIQDVAPYFLDFYFNPDENGNLRLQWKDKNSSFIYGPTDLSDGTIRFIALTTLFMQPNLPSTLVIDEPELGLHPFAIGKLGGLVRSAANKGTQVIIATQSTDLLSQFQPEDVIAVDNVNGESNFNRLDSEKFKEWLNEYSLGDLWKRNIIESGQPQ